MIWADALSALLGESSDNEWLRKRLDELRSRHPHEDTEDDSGPRDHLD
jgi:hypothetical protein